MPHFDFIDKEIKIGDRVVFTQENDDEFNLGEIVEFREEGIVIKRKDEGWPETNYYRIPEYRVVKI